MPQQKLMLINETDDETRIAILEKGKLQELHLEHRNQEQIKGNIYKAVVHKIQPSIQSCFVDFGSDKDGFLALSEINFSLLQKISSDSKVSKIKSGMSILVQVSRDPIAHKGASMNGHLTIPGRYMVLLPYCKNGGVSKKIENDKERDRLKTFLHSLDDEEHGIIIRTAGVGRSLQELKKDYTLLKRKWAKIEQDYKQTDAPGIVLREDDITTRFVRDYYTEEIETLWLDNPETFQRVYQFMKTNIPNSQKNIKLFLENRSLFAHFEVEKQVEQLSDHNAYLPSGGSIVIDMTEALVAIDVNSGRSKASNPKENALNTNLEAAVEIARQLRLRNLGGLVVIDFIDMASTADRQEVENTLKDAMQIDKASHNIGQVSDFGLLELSRQQIAQGFVRTVSTPCPTCLGKGHIPSLLTSSGQVLRTLREYAANGELKKIEANLPISIANYLLNQKRKEITELEEEFDIQIILKADLDSKDTKIELVESSSPEPAVRAIRTNSSRPQARLQTRPQTPKLELLQEPPMKKPAKPPVAKQTPQTRPTAERQTRPITERQARPAAERQARLTTERQTRPTTERQTRPAAERQAVPVPTAEQPTILSEQEIIKRLADFLSHNTLEQKCFFEPDFSVVKKDHSQILAGFKARLTGQATIGRPVFFENRYLWDEMEKTV